MNYQSPDHAPGLRLHFNENTAGCSPAVIAALHALTREEASYYPDYAPITAKCERYFDVAPNWVQVTNGLDEGLHLAAQAAAIAQPGFAALVIEPAFEMYAASVEAVGGRVITIMPEPDFSFPLDRILAAIAPDLRLIYLTDPNNPTGLGIPPDCVEAIAAAAPQATVLVDEAYAEFSGRTFIGPALDRHRNLVVGRTFAKAHGLAALRTGALIAHPDALAPLRRVMPPFSVNIAAVRALEAALDDPAHLEWYVGESIVSRDRIYDFCRRFGIGCLPSEANFVLLRIGDQAAALTDALRERGILVRDKSRAPGCAGCIRITAGVVAHTERCLEELEDLLAPRPR